MPILTVRVSHRIAIHYEPSSSSAFYFGSYGIYPIIPAIQTFLRRNYSAGFKRGTTAGSEQQSQRPIPLPIHPVHGKTFDPETTYLTSHC